MPIEKRCPHCNGRAKPFSKQSHNAFGNRITSYKVHCSCGVSGPWCSNVEEAENKWNNIKLGQD